MIYAELAGGLGNQMFLYAAARALGLRLGQPVTLLDRQDWRDGAPAHTACALRDLCISPEVAITAEPRFAKKHLPLQNTVKALLIKCEQRGGGMLARDWTGFERRAAPFADRLGVHFATDGYLPLTPGPRPKDLLLWGYFQSEQYFADCADTVRAELTPRPALNAEEPLAAAIAAAPCAVCVHVRRGDYQRPENAHLQVCGPAYYARAAAAAAARWPDAVLYVFSDDIEWARAHLDTAGLPAVYVPGGRSAAADLGLMARCRHFILSNSTYGWWAQYLGAAPDKAVLAPDRWYANGKQSALPAPEWTRIETQGP